MLNRNSFLQEIFTTSAAAAPSTVHPSYATGEGAAAEERQLPLTNKF